MKKTLMPILLLIFTISLVSIPVITTEIRLNILTSNSYEIQEDNILFDTNIIHGYVLEYPEGTPLQDVRVECRKSISLPWKSTITDENGYFNFDIRNLIIGPKYYVLWGVKSGYEMLPTYVYTNNRLNFEIEKDLWMASPYSCCIYGQVSDKKSDNPIKDAYVELRKYPYSSIYNSTVTDSQGSYVFELLSADLYKIYVEKPGFRPGHSSEEIYLGSDGKFEIEVDYEMIKNKGLINILLPIEIFFLESVLIVLKSLKF
jgi:hypothetical protein